MLGPTQYISLENSTGVKCKIVSSSEKAKAKKCEWFGICVIHTWLAFLQEEVGTAPESECESVLVSESW